MPRDRISTENLRRERMEVSKPRWWKRPSLALTGGVVGSLLLAACGGSSTGSKTQTLASAYNPAKGVQGGYLCDACWESVQGNNVLDTHARNCYGVQLM